MVDLSSVGGIVSIPLMFVSVLSLAIIIERIIFWNSVLSKQERIRSNILSMHSGNDKIISNNKIFAGHYVVEKVKLLKTLLSLPYGK